MTAKTPFDKIDSKTSQCYIPKPELNLLSLCQRKKRMHKRMISFLILLFLPQIFFSCAGNKELSSLQAKLDRFFSKKEVTVAVTDSGLGGLSIVADASDRMKKSKIFRDVNFIFFNALFSNKGGYNSLKTREEKIRIFDSALVSLEKKYQPDLILIGCNTLSILYDDTPFSQETKIPVVGIVESGVEIIAKNLKASTDSKAIIFGTQTTVGEATHKKKLVKRGFLPERIVTQACPELVNYIERGYTSDETEMLIFAYVDEALQKVKNLQKPIYVSLNCTHYGYSLDSWKKAFLSLGVKPLSFLNPNSKMIDFLFQPQIQNRFKTTNISVDVVSMVEISEEKMDSIGFWLRKVSPKTAEALKNYDKRPDLFEWEKYVISEK